MALRVKHPATPPDFGVDAQGNLVALVNDFQVDVPVPGEHGGRRRRTCRRRRSSAW